MMEGWGRRQFLRGTLGLLAAGRVCSAEEGRDKAVPSSLMQRSWRLDPSCVLPRGPKDSYDSNVAGDACIVWDDQRQTWRMFYFAAGRDGGTALALSRSEDRIGPGAWTKAGQPALANPEALVNRRNWHKWWPRADVLTGGGPVTAWRIRVNRWGNSGGGIPGTPYLFRRASA